MKKGCGRIMKMNLGGRNKSLKKLKICGLHGPRTRHGTWSCGDKNQECLSGFWILQMEYMMVFITKEIFSSYLFSFIYVCFSVWGMFSILDALNLKSQWAHNLMRLRELFKTDPGIRREQSAFAGVTWMYVVMCRKYLSREVTKANFEKQTWKGMPGSTGMFCCSLQRMVSWKEEN